ncbi:hypothetical protein CB0940_09694 [Cercospora beticola]|uniref:Uncharacterized protein n=1 Tax=Cercospora beticola TaxID=122368 RepID=A0A2G5HG38_CERBT|nr:hypothetical protein CB0940_09694 [Cercospora beticola]PIA91514.1 hypothetical protein CB0940_09694 [Cercospora beticola]WPB05966.1 hypothetical protein RHO25_010621 [Cercospora beticola]CAK1365842.1 unnamed protein product [Cercospora beticola]
MAAAHMTSCRISPALPVDVEKQVAMLEMFTMDLDLSLRSGSSDVDSTRSAETTTLNSRHDSLSSGRASSCSSRTSDCGHLSPNAKPVKRVRFEESASWTFFDENESFPQRPRLSKRPSFMTRSLDRIMTRGSSETDVGVPPAALSAMTENLKQLKRRNSTVDIAELATKTTSRYSTPGRRDSLVITVHQPLRECPGRRFNRAQTPKLPVVPAAPAPKGDWDSLLGPPKPNPLAV